MFGSVATASALPFVPVQARGRAERLVVSGQEIAALTLALEKGHAALAAGKPALDAVTAAITVLEDDPLFNAGKGAVFTHDGKNELDASIMDGATLRAGVDGVRLTHWLMLADASQAGRTQRRQSRPVLWPRRSTQRTCPQ